MTAVVAHGEPRVLAAPRVATTVCVTAAATVSLAPSLLPRSAAVQAVVTGVLVALGLAVASLWRRVTERRTHSVGSDSDVRRVVVWCAGAATGATLLLAGHWQRGLREATGAAPVSPAYWPAVLAGAAAVTTALVLTAAGLRRLRRAGIGRLRRNRNTRRVTASVLAATVALAFWIGPAAGAAAAGNTTAGLTLPRPQSPSISGSAESLTPWETLGGEGRRFATASAAPSTVRTYVGLDSAPDSESRVRLAIRELDRAGGFTRSNLVIAVPTGSGWVDANALAGFEQRFGGDVAEVAVQYSAAPSWATFVLDRRSAAESARALYSAVAQHVSQLSPASRPNVYVYGQSLGAMGAAAAADGAYPPCGVLLAGLPAGVTAPRGATVLANASDPVVHWSPRLLVAPPRLDGTRRDAPTPPWLPVVSFVQTTVDLLTSLDSAPGHGHRYGTDQGTALPHC
ncbi:alpha/beta-hydrolase family protein [Rhodococcus gannanensis]|uniref:Alpha/beta-hydrolase family protein n=1 Tax=Rhodococcus gannanensis TaxID=1960308 RepID=A0ABW4P1I9_9NOCA